MSAYNFKKEFVPPIRTGGKKQTIRKKRKYQCKQGDMLQLYTGMRTKYCERIMDDQECKSVDDIIIYRDKIEINGIFLSFFDMVTLAADDGFDCLADFLLFFHDHYSLPFTGVLIKWGSKDKNIL